MFYDAVIIGSGPAGLAAALYLARANKRVCIVEGEAIGGQLAKSPCIENYPGFVGSGYDLAMAMYDQVALYDNVDFEFNTVNTITKLSDGSFACTCEDGTVINSDYVIDAVGVKHKHLPCLPGEMDHVHYCATCDGAFYKDKRVAVIGDGNTALQYALELSNYCAEVELITMFDKFFGETILVDRVMEKENIFWTYNTTVNAVNSCAEGIILSNQDSVTKMFDGIFVAIGQEPIKMDLPNDVLIYKGLIIVRPNQETLCSGLYAVGDCTYKKIKQVTLAAAEGTTAALDIIGKEN